MLTISRASVYYRPRPVSPSDLALMRRIDELHRDYPFAGAVWCAICWLGQALSVAGCASRR
jgi:hypothetical protein